MYDIFYFYSLTGLETYCQWRGEQRAHTFFILHVDHHHSRGVAPTNDIIHHSSLLRFAEQNKVSTVPTSVRRRRCQSEAEPDLMQ